jgi:hypothetical protein
MILVRDHHFGLFVRSNPRQNIAYDFFHCYRPVFLIEQKWVRFNLRSRHPHSYQEDREKEQKAAAHQFHAAAARSCIFQTEHSKIPYPLATLARDYNAPPSPMAVSL